MSVELSLAWDNITNALKQALIDNAELRKRIRVLENHIEELEAELEEGVNEVGLP